jgi:hypothetical protein
MFSILMTGLMGYRSRRRMSLSELCHNRGEPAIILSSRSSNASLLGFFHPISDPIQHDKAFGTLAENHAGAIWPRLIRDRRPFRWCSGCVWKKRAENSPKGTKNYRRLFTASNEQIDFYRRIFNWWSVFVNTLSIFTFVKSSSDR